MPGIFKKMTDEAGLNYDVSLSTRNAASLRGQFLDTAPTGLSQTSCNTTRTIAANPNASAATKVYLEQTWARPDMVEAHKITTPDLTSADGRPMVDTSAAGGNATLYYTSLADMTADLHASFYGKAASNAGFAGVVPVGDAFQRAVDQGLAQGSGFYNAGGTFAETAGALKRWWLDRTHASKYGSYLSALTLFGSITGRDPLTLGAGEQAALDLGIDGATALALQRVASEQLGYSAAVPEPQGAALALVGLVALGLRGSLRTGKRPGSSRPH